MQQGFESLLSRDREDEIRGVVKFTEEDIAFLDELQELVREFQ